MPHNNKNSSKVRSKIHQLMESKIGQQQQRPADVRREFIVCLSIAMCLLVPIFYALRVSIGDVGSGTILVVALSTLSFAATPLILRYSNNDAAAAGQVFATMTVMTVLLVQANGGLHAPVFAIFLCLPILAAFLFGIRAGVLVTGSLIGLLALLTASNSVWLSSAPLIKGADWAIARAAMASLALFLVILVVWYYERQHRLLVEALRHGASHDPLTGLANRAALSLCLKQALGKLDSNNNKPLSIIMFDIDHFKQYNDRYGHQGGDRALQEVARIAREAATRESDVVARFGGDEFVMVLPNTDSTNALYVARRLQDLASRLPKSEEKNSALTLSIGVATTLPQRSTRQGSELLERADRALYQAKEKGRNQIATDQNRPSTPSEKQHYRAGELHI